MGELEHVGIILRRVLKKLERKLKGEKTKGKN